MIFMRKNAVKPFFFSLAALCLVFSLGAFAFEAETPEGAAERTLPVAANLLDDAVYGEKPSESTDDGVLIFFDNGNPDDLINNGGITLQGVTGAPYATDGYYTRSINTGDTPFQGETFGPCIVASDGVSFKDADGNSLHGKLTFYVELYNSSTSDKKFHTGVKPKPAADSNWDLWAKIYTKWASVSAAASSWSTLKFTYDTSANTLCFGRNAWDYRDSHVRSVYVYYKELTPAEKPAETTEDGELIFFDNGNASDSFDRFGLKLGGVASAVYESDGAMTRSINVCDAIFAGNTYGPYVESADGELFKDAAGKALNGKLTLYVELYNSSDSAKGYYAVKKPAADGWDSWCNVFTNWKSVSAASKTWSTLKYTFDASANLIGLARTGWDPNNSNIRSVYVYYAPATVYAEKPAENTDYGKLIYFDNGNESDKVNLSNITLGGLLSTLDTTDHTYTRSINTGDTIFAGNTFGVYVSASGETFTDADGNALDGELTVCVELYNSASGLKNYYDIQKPAADGWTEWCNVYTNWRKTGAEPGAWTTLTLTRDTSATLLGFARDSWDPNNSNVRAVYVYYKATEPPVIATADKYSIRTATPAGIRFGGFVSVTTLKNADECGFILARGDILEKNGFTAEDEVKIAAGSLSDKSNGSFAAATANGLKLAGARNYVNDGTVNKLIESADGKTDFGDYGVQGYSFTSVAINLDNGYTHADGTQYAHRYNVPLTARAYVKIGDTYYYGACVTKSIKEVAETIKAAGGDAYTANKEYIDTILDEADKTA